MSQRYLYPVLAIIAFLISFNPVLADNLLLNFTFDAAVRTSAWSDDGSILAVWTQTALYTIDMHSHELSELQTYGIEGTNAAPYKMLWSPDNTKLALLGYEDYSSTTILDVQTGLELYSENGVVRPAFVSFSSNSRKVVIAYCQYISNQVYESDLIIVDIDSNETPIHIELGGSMGACIERLVWHPDGNQLAIQIGGFVSVYNLEADTEITGFKASDDTFSFFDLAWNPNGTEIITYGYTVRRWDATTGEPIMSFDSGLFSLENDNITWLTEAAVLVTGYRRANAFDTQTGHLLYYYELPEGVTASWSPLGRFAVSTQENQIFIYAFEPIPAPQRVAFEINIEANPRTSETDVMTGLAHWSLQGDILLTTATTITNLSQPATPVYSIEVENAQLDSSLFSNDGRIVALGLSDRDTSHYEIQVWDVQQNEMLHQFTGHTGLIYELEFNADNTLLASGSSDTTIRVWNLNTGEQVSEMWGHYGGIADIAFSPDSHLLASVADETMRVWDTPTGEQLHVVNPYSDYVIGGHYTFGVQFSPDGQHIIYHDETFDMMQGGIQVRVWNRDTEDQSYFREQMYYRSDVMYSADGDFVALTNLYADVQLFETQNHTKIELPSKVCAGSNLVLDEFRAYWLGTVGDDGEIELSGNVSEANWFDFSPNGQVIAQLVLQACLPAPLEGNETEDMFEYNTIWLVDTDTGAIQHILRGNESPSYRMFFSPDGTQLLTQHLDRTIKLWDVESGEQIPILRL